MKTAKKTKSSQMKKPTKPAKAKAKTGDAPTAKPAAKPAAAPASNGSRIYIGIGGWTFEPWRGVFYPDKLPHAKELGYASERLTSIEVNGTFYRSQTPATFRKWAGEVPQGFVFALKGPRFATNRRVLKEAGNSIKRFLNSGVTELGAHLGPLLWQFAPTKKFDAADFGGFLELLPDQYNGHAIRHVVEVRHDSFSTPEFTALLRTFKIPVVFTDHVRYPNIADITGDFVYARLQRGKDTIVTPIRKMTSTPGPVVCKPGPQAARRTICSSSMPRTKPPPKPARVMYSPTSSTKAKCARPPALWR